MQPVLPPTLEPVSVQLVRLGHEFQLRVMLEPVPVPDTSVEQNPGRAARIDLTPATGPILHGDQDPEEDSLFR
jgi:hypothetical protein